MAYLSLYRKYRSQTFDEVSGQEHVIRTLQNAIRSGRVAHAYLFCGPRGTGKTTSARLLAKALNCEQGPTADPCNRCAACTQIAEGRYLDMKEIDAASNRGIDEIRALRDQVAYAAAEGRYKVYVIDEAHQITGDAFNAFLKTLEEPPPRVVFVMATTEAHKIPATIVSRCQKFEFRRASIEQLRERVAFVAQAEGAEIDPAALDLIAREANGGWRDALSLLEQVLAFSEGRVTAKDVYTVLGTVEAETLFALADAIRTEQGAEIYRLLETLIAEGKDPRQLLRDLTAHFRTLMLAAAGTPPPGEPDQAARYEAQAREFGHLRLVRALQVLAQTDREARWSEQPRLLLELAAVRLMFGESGQGSVVSGQKAAGERAPSAAPRPRESTPSPQPARQQPAADRRPPAPVSAPPSTVHGPRSTVGAERSPFVDETPAPAKSPSPPVDPPSPVGGARSFHELPAPPLTVGDARQGRDDDGDYSGMWDTAAAPTADGRQPTAAELPETAARAVDSPLPAGRGAGGVGPEPEPAPPGDREHDLEVIARKWKVIMEELKRVKMVQVQSCLVDTQPARFEKDVLVIRFPRATLAEVFQKRGKEFPEALSQAILTVTGIACKIRAEVVAPSGKPAAPAGAASRTPVRPAEAPFERTISPPATATPAASPAPAAAPARTPRAASPKSEKEAPAPPAPPAPARTGSAPAPGGSEITGPELIHNVVEVLDGQLLDPRE